MMSVTAVSLIPPHAIPIHSIGPRSSCPGGVDGVDHGKMHDLGTIQYVQDYLFGVTVR
jgi:hypothetical protein